MRYGQLFILKIYHCTNTV